MSGFFGFSTELPERRPGQPQPGNGPGVGHGSGGPQGFQGFASAGNDSTAFGLGGLSGGGGGAGEEEDLAVYNWGDNMGSLMEGGDDLNDETFGGSGPVGNDFLFSSAPGPAPKAAAKGQGQQRGPVASTQSRYKPKVAADPFAFSENDFYSSRRPASKPPATKVTKPQAPAVTQTKAKPTPSPQPMPVAVPSSVESLWNKAPLPAQGMGMWGASPAASIKPSGPLAREQPATLTGPPPAGQIKTLEEIEAEMSRMSLPPPPASQIHPSSAAPPTQPQQPHQMLSLEEIERQMMEESEPPVAQPPTAPSALTREPTPPQIKLAGSGYAAQQALLDQMFPELGVKGPAPGERTASFPTGPGAERPRPSPEEQARMHAIHERVTAKIESMAKYNHLMGNSDKDFITRIQLSQLATADPYASDFYAQVFSALRKRQEIQMQGQGQGQGQGQAPTVVQVAPGFAFGVSGPANRFGKMGTKTMDKLSGQVKKLVESRASHQKASNTAALQGALGKINTRGGLTAPRPVLSVPIASKPEHRPTSILNNQSGIRRSPLTKKQVMFALEELYSSVLELEQMRRDMPPPPPTAVEDYQRWSGILGMKVEEIWRRLMVMEPLDVSNPHPFISLMNATKGQRLFPRLLRHLAHQQALTLLTLIVATYPQLDVVAKAPPPPVTDSSLLTKADRMDRARREAETDSFLHCIVPGLDMLIQRCTLGLVAGLLGICAQRMEVWRVACTRPGVALFTALLSRAQNIIRGPPVDPSNPQGGPPPPDPAEIEQWSKTYAYFLSLLIPHLPELFPSSAVQRSAFGPGAYLMNSDTSEKDGLEMERRDAEVWGFTAALAVNAPEEEQTSLVAALREKILHTVQSSRGPGVSVERKEMKLRNVNMFLNGLGLDASMIE